MERPAGCSVIPAGRQVRRDVAARKPSLGLRRGQMKSAAGGSPLPAAFGPATLRRRQARKPSLRFSRGQMETKRPPGGPIDPAALVAGPPRAGPISIAHGNEISRRVSAVPGGREVWPQGAARKPSLRLSRGQIEKRPSGKGNPATLEQTSPTLRGTPKHSSPSRGKQKKAGWG